MCFEPSRTVSEVIAKLEMLGKLFKEKWEPCEIDFHVFVDFRSSMPRNINLEELKAKFSGLRPALRPASPGQQSPNMDLIAELKSNNWTASLKKTKKKRQGEENKVRAKFVFYLHNDTVWNQRTLGKR